MEMSMTRDAYAKELIKAAEAVFRRNEAATCPHEDCDEHLSAVRQNTFSTRSLFCPVHGHLFQEQVAEPFSKLDWDGAKARFDAEYSDADWDEDEGDEEECLD
jgi:hypothetical protein